jgi:hypothetical protein
LLVRRGGSIESLAFDLQDGEVMVDPKWAVLVVVLSVFAMAASYDLQLGLAAGAGLAVLTLIYLTIRTIFLIEPAHELAKRSELSSRIARLSINRRKAAEDEKAGRPPLK